MTVDYTKSTIHSLSAMLAAGEVTSREIVESYCRRAAALDGKVKAFLHLDAERLLAAADASDARRAAGRPLSPYDGIPIGIKDCIVSKDEHVSCASKILEPVISPYDSTAVARLRKLGFIPAGRLNMDEFAMGSSCENSAYQKTANPSDLNRVPGGSSGGSAAAVGARFVPAALGSDTGGSIRQPAAFCGEVGLKPTYGRVSRYGLVAFASSLDQIGPMTLDTLDAAILLDAIAGRDEKDSTSLDVPAGGFADAVRNAPADLSGLRVGLPKEYFNARWRCSNRWVRRWWTSSCRIRSTRSPSTISSPLPKPAPICSVSTASVTERGSRDGIWWIPISSRAAPVSAMR